ncbi:MAG: hypothetical protein SGJ20_01030 [Planctomycetota bacterium]|nr:hypothetical protein [Planctomycetota bacterium]
MGYLLTCQQCGRTIEVQPAQAGQQVHCDCGAAIDVPKLRDLKNLPAAEVVPVEVAYGSSGWSARKGMILAGISIALISLIFSTVLHFRPSIESQYTIVDPDVSDVPPEAAWRLWSNVFKRGLATWQPKKREEHDNLSYRDRNIQFFEIAGYVVAAGGALLAVAGYLSPNKKRRGA